MRIALIGSMTALTLVGCTATTPPPPDREARLLTLASQEAQQIKDPTQRLTRQLNFASSQLSRSKFDEARKSLAFAAQTLHDAGPADLSPQIRIAGWVSISELSQSAKDTPTAITACDQAVVVLKNLPTVTDRPEYVIGVAHEVEVLEGKPAAAKLLKESADWVGQMPDETARRIALVAISDATFNDEDYDAGLTVLRTDKDATWRSDTLARLAEEHRFAPMSIQGAVTDNTVFRDANGNVVANDAIESQRLEWLSNSRGSALGLVAGVNARSLPTTPPADSVKSFGKPVDFQSIFQGKIGLTSPATTKP